MHHIFNVHRSINVCLNKDPKVINCLWLSINISFNISSKIFLHQLLSCKFRPWCFSRFSILRPSYLFLSSVEDMRLSFSIPEKFNLTNVFSYTALLELTRVNFIVTVIVSQYVNFFSSVLFRAWGETDFTTQLSWKSSTSAKQ